MHILEEWAKKSQRKRKRTDDTPGPTAKYPMTSGPPGKPGPSGQLGPSGQPEPSTLDSSMGTPVVDPTPAANPTPAADPAPGVHPPVIASPAVCPLPICPLPVCPPAVCPPPVADTLGGSFGRGLQGLDDPNTLAKWVAQCWPIWHHCAIYVANCVRYCNDEGDTIRIVVLRWSHRTISGPMLQDVSLMGRPGASYISLIYTSGGLPWSLPREKMVFIEWDKDLSTWLKLTGDKDIPNPVLPVLPQAAPDPDGGRLLASVKWILC